MADTPHQYTVRSALVELTLARIRELTREPEAVFWVFVFPIVLAAILSLATVYGFDAAGPRWGAEAAWLLAGLIAWYLVVYRGGEPSALHFAALPYALLLASTAGFATGLALQSPAFVPLALGAALFLLSDLILASEVFNGRSFPLIGDVIWLTYGPAQALIVYSVNAALLVTQQPLSPG